MDKMKWIIFAVIILAVFGGIYWFNRSDTPSFTGDASKVISEGPIADRVYGSSDQKVILVEYGDFQCPACGRMFEPLKELKETYKDQLTFVFRNFPLTNIHPNALAASSAAEAAGQQGKFWEMHDLLYQTQAAWSEVSIDQRSAVFEGYATQLGLNIDTFKKDIASKEVSDKISRDRSSATTMQGGVDSTPTFFINGVKLDSNKSTDAAALKEAVTKAIQEQYPDRTNTTNEQ